MTAPAPRAPPAQAVPVLFGLETEYAVAAVGADGKPLAGVAERLLGIAKTDHPNLPDSIRGAGMFLPNGARFYLDRGDHPEYSTPECTSPWDLLRQVRQGEALMLDLAERLRSRGGPDVSIYRSNVDCQSRATWGVHESFLVGVDPASLAADLLPFLATRVVYTGSGGFVPGRAGGWQFTLSPRSHLLDRASSTESTHGRGLFHLKDEPLAGGGWRRLHLICGDGLCGDMGIVLRSGATALVLAALQLGRRPGNDIRPAACFDALRAFAADRACRTSVPVLSGGQARAIDIQRGYLGLVESSLDEGFWPHWAEEVCRLWREQLDQLARDPAGAVASLDWVLKDVLFPRWVSPEVWGKFRRLSFLLQRLERVAQRIAPPEDRLSVLALLGREPIPALLERLTPLVRGSGSSWDELRAFVSLGPRLKELDFRFGQLGDLGVHARLDARGATRRLVERSPAGLLLLPPPPGTRAAIRGEMVARLSAEQEGARFQCDWSGIHDFKEHRTLDLSDPFGSEARWRDRPEPRERVPARTAVRQLLAELF